MKKLLSLILSTLLLVGCSSSNKQKIVVGSKNFTENEILAEIYALALEDNGYEVERKFDISSSAVHTSITSNKIDLYPGYTGTAYISILKKTEIVDGESIYNIVKKEYNEKYKLTWLGKSPANDSQALAITSKASKEFNIKTISDLQKNASSLRFASQGEFDKRSDGIPGLTKVYGEFNWKSSKVYDNSLKYSILEKDEADVIPAYSTEGQLASNKFVLLEDDKNFWPAYNVAPIVRNSVVSKNKNLAKILDPINKKITTKDLQTLNKKVDIDKEDYEDVAKEYYNSIK